jgi:sterol desaturase/sphingolipid hydroxylase (fatty acid hydroxylase superfamily)
MSNNTNTKQIQRKQSLPTENKISGNTNAEDLKPLVPIYFYTPTVLILAIAAVISAAHSLLAIGGLLVIGWFLWGLFEYSFHRFILHRSEKPNRLIPLPGNATHHAHHRDPKAHDRLYIPLHEGIPTVLAFWLITWSITGSWQTTAFLYAGFMIGYLVYEWIDYEAHHGKSRSRLMRYYKKYHLQHHHVDEAARYGVTTPIFDYLFGTYHVENRAKNGAAQKIRSEVKA